MTLSYSKKLIRWALVNYADLSCGLSPRVLDELKQFNKVRKSGTAQQTIIIIKADIDAAITSLAPKHDIWGLLSLNMTAGMLLQAARHPQLSALQRRIVGTCIIESCAGCGVQFAPSYCENDWTIGRMRNYLNGKSPANAEHKT
jgi:hypothetical protein